MSLFNDVEEFKRRAKAGEFESEEQAREYWDRNVGTSDEVRRQYEAGDIWDELKSQIPTAESQQLQYGTDVKPYETGAPLVAGQERAMLPWEAESFGLQGGSAYRDAESAYGGLGPSAYEGMGPSAYEGMGPSAYGDLAFDPNRMGESQDYFASVMKDPIDDIAEADYARRQGQAEQARRSHAEAALIAAEQKGQGAYGDAILAELIGNQAMAGDMYQAGMDANAIAQARRDSAAGSLGDLSHLIARGELDADTARALGLDRYGMQRAGGMDTYAANRASGLDAYGTNVASGLDAFTGDRARSMDDWANQRYNDYYGIQQRNVESGNKAAYENWMRGNTTGDANVDAWNEAAEWNKIGAPQQYFGDQMTVAAGKTGQLSDLGAAQMREEDDGEQALKKLGKVAKIGAGAVKAVTGGFG